MKQRDDDCSWSDDAPPSAPLVDTDPTAWRVRRRFLAATVAFCMSTVAYCLHYELRGPVPETAVMMAFGTMATLVTGYVLGAVADDRYEREHRRAVRFGPSLLPGTRRGRGA